MLALLTLAYGEYAMKKLRLLNGMGGSRNGKKTWKMTQEVGSQIHKGQIQKMDHPPYSPELAPCNSRLFPKYKKMP
jgi:hypothetical protein